MAMSMARMRWWFETLPLAVIIEWSVYTEVIITGWFWVIAAGD